MAILKANLAANFTRIKIFYDWGLCEDYRRAPGQSNGVHRPAALFLQGQLSDIISYLDGSVEDHNAPVRRRLGVDDARGKRLRATGIPVARGIYWH
jgi:hypothetical protein